MCVERHLVNDTHTYFPVRGNNTGVCGCSFGRNSCNLPGVCGPCVLRREKLVSYNNITHTHTLTPIIRCYFVCTHNRIRSPRLAAFGRIEIRWVREVGKFGPYLRYKDWLRRLQWALAFTSFFGGESEALARL